MNPEDQVIADIDAFIDEQLAAGEPENGYDYEREFTFPVRFSSPTTEALRIIFGWKNPAFGTESPSDRLAREMTELGKVIAESVLPVVQELCNTWSGILAPVMDLPDHEPPREDGRPPLPRPSHTPPMWAVDANRSHRRRNH